MRKSTMRFAFALPIQWSKGIGKSSIATIPLGALFGEFEAAQRFCQAVDKVGNFLKPRSHMAEVVSLAERRARFIKEVEELETISKTA